MESTVHMLEKEVTLSRSSRLLGDVVMKKLAEVKVIVIGLGGVGSWCAEALVRTGICNLTMVDIDDVAASNINRQLMATCKTVGQPKVNVLKERLLEINPEANIVALHRLYTKESAADFHLEEYDYMVDAIDSLEDKANLILHATSMPGKFYSSMGAALKLDPTRIRVDEFWKVQGCPLARALRNKFKKRKEFPTHKFLCVFSDELLENKGNKDDSTLLFHKVAFNGSLCHITATFGMMLSGMILKDIYECVQKEQES